MSRCRDCTYWGMKRWPNGWGGDTGYCGCSTSGYYTRIVTIGQSCTEYVARS
jgi:hypothetical protein